MKNDKSHIFKIGVFAIMFDDNKKILFCHRTDYDLWNLPRGVLEKNEAPWQAVVREVKEETGLDVTVRKFTGVYYNPNREQIVFSFICNTIGGELTVNEESDKFKYFTFNDIPKNTSPAHVLRIRDALEKPDEIILKIEHRPSSVELIKQGKL